MTSLNQISFSVFDEILEKRIGHGKAQFLISSSFYIIWLCDGGENLVVAFMLPILKREWDLTSSMVSLIGSLIFLSWGIGAVLSGQLADRWGRRKTMIYSCFMQFLFGLLSTFVTSFTQFLIFRALFGLSNGLSNPLTSSFVSEIVPRSHRGRFFVHIFNAFPIGEIIIVACAGIFLTSLDQGNWRALLFVSSLPGLVAFICSLKFLIESPRYLMCCKKDAFEEAIQSLNYMGKLNHSHSNNMLIKNTTIIKKKEEIPISQNTTEPSFKELNSNEIEALRQWAHQSYKGQSKIIGSVSELFQGKTLGLTFRLMAMWFSLSFVYYGIVFILPMMIISMQKENDSEGQSSLDLTGIFIACFAEIPSNILAYYAIEDKRFGRKNSMTICYGVCAACSILVFFTCSTLNLFFFFLVGCTKFFINFSFCIIFPFTAEVYITALRTTGIGVNNAVCRLGGVLMPWISVILFNLGVTGPFLAFAIISTLSAYSSYSIKKDTTNRNLDTYEKEDEETVQELVDTQTSLLKL